ncbi:MAG: M1 family metallopeptidase [Holophagales bacterium]|nr:M1 family metallopeptidase [Holophagales bacterium]
MSLLFFHPPEDLLMRSDITVAPNPSRQGRAGRPPRLRRAMGLAAGLVLGLATACGSPPADDTSSSTGEGAPEAGNEAAARIDVHSAARPEQVSVKHIALDLEVGFDAQRLSGSAVLELDRHDPEARLLHLDTRGLDIGGVFLLEGTDGTEAEGTEAVFRLGEELPYLGQALEIEISELTSRVRIEYATRPDAAALQWLSPAQTTGGEHPFLFSQSQAILARTWVPCQDTPAVRFTYEATVRVPASLMAVMSAENPRELAADGVYRFTMPQPIPSYLLAIAVGDLEFRELGERTGVYAEPAMVEKAAWELAETEQMMNAVEELYGPYRWGRFDVLVLPPSFPYGGMENPRLTFATPTILAGDRSLVALIAHELAHSWSGNLVTNATWNDFWLNEGFTVYLESRIMEAVYGRDYADMLTVLGLQDLRATLDDMGTSADSHLFLDLEGRDPDDGMTDVAYEKGHFFLRTVEQTVGRERFDSFLRTWFDEHAFVSRTTGDFVAYLDQRLVAGDAQLAEKLQVEAWVYGPGLPANLQPPESDAFARVDAGRQAFLDGSRAAGELGVEGWTTHHWLHFLRGLPEDLSAEQMAELDAAFGLTGSGNSEILAAWFRHVLAQHYEPGYDALRDFLSRQGRRKFLRPLYQDMVDHGLKPMAEEIYTRARPSYHSVSTGTLDAILEWQE